MGLTRSRDLYLLLVSSRRDGGAAVRLARMAQAACRELVVIVPALAGEILDSRPDAYQRHRYLYGF